MAGAGATRAQSRGRAGGRSTLVPGSRCPARGGRAGVSRAAAAAGASPPTRGWRPEGGREGAVRLTPDPARAAAARRGERVAAAAAQRPAAVAAAATAAELAPGTPVRNTTVLVVGATGTLGRQVVRRALDEGYEVRCLVRPRENPAEFLRDWGASTVNGDLLKPESLPPALVGIHTVIDCATARPEESVRKTDWEGKVALIQACQAMKIQKFVFFSVTQCDQHLDIPLMNTKYRVEQFLGESGLDFTVLRLCGFMQSLIGNYAVPVLEERDVWGTDDQTRTAYMDTQDVARFAMAAVNKTAASGRTLDVSGPRPYTISEVISLCERYAGQDAKVTSVPIWFLKAVKNSAAFFQWSRDAAERLAFAELLAGNFALAAPMEETYKVLEIEPTSVMSVEKYLSEYFTQILKKLKEVGAESRQNDFYL